MLGIGIVEFKPELLIEPVSTILVVVLSLIRSEFHRFHLCLRPAFCPCHDLIHQIGTDAMASKPVRVEENGTINKG